MAVPALRANVMKSRVSLPGPQPRNRQGFSLGGLTVMVCLAVNDYASNLPELAQKPAD